MKVRVVKLLVWPNLESSYKVLHKQKVLLLIYLEVIFLRHTVCVDSPFAKIENFSTPLFLSLRRYDCSDRSARRSA